MRTCRLARPEARRAAGGRWLAAGGHVREEGAAAGAGVSPTAGGCGGSSSPLEPGPPALLLIYKHTKGRAGVASAAGMGDKKSPTRPKRQPKPSSDEGYWDCSVCTFRNSAEAFKCMMCDVRKGTSTRKPRPVSQLVAQQVTQQFVPPTQSKKEKKDKVEKEKSEKETTSKKNSHKKTRPRLKNVDRSSAQHLEVTVGDLTVIITDFKEKTKSPPASSTASADQHSQSGSSSDNTERGMSRSSSPRGEASSLNGESH
ncbi:YY1-associated factor 2 isoform X1 [Mauremys reevesii]|uniref:YY1-associated factor 2 isoform X1 n=1 Tax=Mauremys reevesii TaxID=260615 RepID=UPI00193F1CA8|nr:YY1-associated factor 2 isoform X1 [Mauremys reevesii]